MMSVSGQLTLNARYAVAQREDVAERDPRVQDMKQRDLDFDGKTCREAASDEVLQLLEVRVGDGHQVHDGHHLEEDKK